MTCRRWLLATLIPVGLGSSGCALRRHALSIPGIGTFERVEIIPWDSSQSFTRYAFTLDSMWPITLIVVGLSAAILVYRYRRGRPARRVSSVVR